MRSMNPSQTTRTASCTPRTGIRRMRWTKRDVRMRGTGFPDFLPSAVRELQEPNAREMARNICRAEVQVEGRKVMSSFVPPEDEHVKAERPPLLLIHGFDSSCMEFRRLRPRLAERNLESWSVDLLGWGFTDPTPCFGALEDDANHPIGPVGCGPEAKTKHLHAFWTQHLQGRPMVLLGASLGGAAALHFALRHPEAVEALVLVDAQGFIEGIGPMATLPTPFAKLGLQVLKSVPLRDIANRMAYFNKEQYATQEARDIGRLHCLLPHWEEANLSFMQSGGYSISSDIERVFQETLVLWGEQDTILEPRYAMQFQQTLPNATLRWIKESGHVPHLEQPEMTAQAIEEFLQSLPARTPHKSNTTVA